MMSVVHRLDQRYRALMCTSRCLCTTTQWTRQNRSRVESSWATKESKTEEPKAETRLSMDKRGQHWLRGTSLWCSYHWEDGRDTRMYRSGTTSRISWGRSHVACLAGNLESGRPKEPKPSPASQWTRGDSTDCVAPVCDVLTIERKEGTDVKLSAWSGARSRLSSSRSCPPIPSQWSRPGLR